MTRPDLSAPAARRALDRVHPASLDAGGDPVDVYARAVWSVLVEPGDGVAGALVARRGAAEALEIAATGGGDGLDEARERWLPRLDPRAIAEALDTARRGGARLVVPADDAWPGRLDDLGDHAPIALWMRGPLAPASGAPVVAIVGARAATSYGEHVTAEIAADLAASGVVVVSGAAYGIDGVAHRAALSAGGSTAAFLAGGVDRAYPRGHTELLGRIARSGGVWSETPCATAPTKWRFLSRNRLIAAFADAVVVVEAGWRSGSLNTAAHAAALGRPLGAVPGPVTSAASAGCHRILRELDGILVTGSGDVREMLGWETPPPPETPEGRTDSLTRVLDAMSARTGRTVSEIVRLSGVAPREVETLLGLAELDGRVERRGDAWRRRTG